MIEIKTPKILNGEVKTENAFRSLITVHYFSIHFKVRGIFDYDFCDFIDLSVQCRSGSD